MVTTDTAVTALAAALAVARAEGREVRSLKDLLCDCCGDAVALCAGGYCHACTAEMNLHAEARADENHAAVVEGQSGEDLARWCVGDDEGELLARGIRC